MATRRAAAGLAAAILVFCTVIAHASLPPVVLQAAGSMRPVTIMVTGTPDSPSWVSQFQTLTRGLVTTNYNPAGAEVGEANILAHQVDFALSPVALDNNERLLLNATLITFPVLLDALEISYNIPSQWISGRLNLTADILSEIYQGKITHWNDAAILALNPNLNANYSGMIYPVARSDGAGATEVFTVYLNVAASGWALGVGKTISWPAIVTRAIGDTALIKVVKDTPGSIGYETFGLVAITAGVSSAALRNADGFFITPTLQTIAAAATAFESGGLYPDGSASWAAVILVNQPGANSWPITHYEFAMFYQDQRRGGAKGAALAAFMNFMVSTQAQNSAAAYGYVPIGNSLRGANIESLNKLLFAEGYSLTSYWNPYPPPPVVVDDDLNAGTIGSLVVISIVGVVLLAAVAVFGFLEWRTNDVEFL